MWERGISAFQLTCRRHLELSRVGPPSHPLTSDAKIVSPTFHPAQNASHFHLCSQVQTHPQGPIRTLMTGLCLFGNFRVCFACPLIPSGPAAFFVFFNSPSCMQPSHMLFPAPGMLFLIFQLSSQRHSLPKPPRLSPTSPTRSGPPSSKQFFFLDFIKHFNDI